MYPLTLNNPISPEYYADPEARFYEGAYYIYATRSRKYHEQLGLDAFCSADGRRWEKIENIVDMSGFPHVYQAVWAPTVVEKGGKYYLIFAVNDIQNDDAVGGLEIAVSDSPRGPFRGYLGRPLVGKFYNKAQPIDAHLFKDDDEGSLSSPNGHERGSDGTIYLYYGGWGHCNVAIMNQTMDGFTPFESGEIFREITPERYVEGPCMLRRGGKYYFMWSVGGWGNDSYGVCYGISDSPLGPFPPEEQILRTDPKVAKGPGHHGYLFDGNGQGYIVYHRRPLTETDANSRQLCIDKMNFDENGKIRPIIMT